MKIPRTFEGFGDELRDETRSNKFNEGIRIQQDIKAPYTVGDLKKYINELPDDMPVLLFDETMNQPRWSFVSTVDVEEIDNLDSENIMRTKEYKGQVLVIGV